MVIWGRAVLDLEGVPILDEIFETVGFLERRLDVFVACGEVSVLVSGRW